MRKPFPVLCRDCKHSEPDPSSTWTLRCLNPAVNSKDYWALASMLSARGTSCTVERDRTWFSPCGMKGKLWELKETK